MALLKIKKTKYRKVDGWMDDWMNGLWNGWMDR